MGASRRYPPEVMRRAVELVRSSGRPVAHIAAELGMGSESLRVAVRAAEAAGQQPEGTPEAELAGEVRRLRREVEELRRTNEILRLASAYFAQELDPVRRSGTWR